MKLFYHNTTTKTTRNKNCLWTVLKERKTNNDINIRNSIKSISIENAWRNFNSVHLKIWRMSKIPKMFFNKICHAITSIHQIQFLAHEMLRWRRKKKRYVIRNRSRYQNGLSIKFYWMDWIVQIIIRIVITEFRAMFFPFFRTKSKEEEKAFQMVFIFYSNVENWIALTNETRRRRRRKKIMKEWLENLLANDDLNYSFRELNLCNSVLCNVQ